MNVTEEGEEDIPFIRISHILLPESWPRRGRPNAGRKLGGGNRHSHSLPLIPFWVRGLSQRVGEEREGGDASDNPPTVV